MVAVAIDYEEEIFGNQMPRLWTAPDRHRDETDGCKSCAISDDGLGGIGCGNYLATEMLDWARGFGYKADPWQEWVMREACGTRPDGKWASFENDLIVSRQNGKGTILEIRELAGMFVLGEELIIHTAHELKTAQEHFRRVVSTVENYPALSRRLKGKPRASHGEEAIELISEPTLIFGSGRRRMYKKVGPRLRFLARSRGSARGFTCNCLIYDEAMILSAEAVGASMPTMAAVPNSQMWLTGSAGLEDSEQLARSRRRIVHNTKDLFGAEWSVRPHLVTCPVDRENGRTTNNYVVCEEHDDRDDPVAWAKANPAFGYRLSAEFTKNEMATLATVEFDRERLGVGQWPAEDEAWRVVSEDLFKSLTLENPGNIPAGGQLAFALDVDEGGANSTIAVSWTHKDGCLVMEIPKNCSRPGTDWVVDRLEELVKKYHPLAIVAPRNGPAAGLGDDLEKLWPKHHKFGSRLIRTGPADEAAAFAWFVQQCKSENKPLRHLGEKKGYKLWHAVGTAEKRVVGDGGETWSRRDSTTDITPATACNLAAWGLNKKRRNYDLLASVR
jgi:hypothetical protein